MTLAEFLLARLAEDEAEAEALQSAYERDEVRPPGRLVNLSALVVPAQVLAEVDAKRRIVTDISVVTRDPFGVLWPDGYREALEHTLRLLALPYADHPDYRQEWTP